MRPRGRPPISVKQNTRDVVVQPKQAHTDDTHELPPPSIAAQLQVAQRGHSLNSVGLGESVPPMQLLETGSITPQSGALVAVSAVSPQPVVQRMMEPDHQGGTSFEQVAKIASDVPPSNGKDCDRWAKDFQDAIMGLDDVKFTSMKLIVRRNKKNGIARGAKIRFDGKEIGFDTHYFTIVTIGGQRKVFDNINPEGIEVEDHKGRMSFYLMREEFLRLPDIDDDDEQYLEEVSFADHVIVDRQKHVNYHR